MSKNKINLSTDLTQTNNQYISGKSLTLPNSFIPHEKMIPKTKEEITADISSLISEYMKNIQNIHLSEASIGNILLFFDAETNTSHIQNLSSVLAIKTDNLNVSGNVNASDGNFTGDLEANNINLLGDLTATNLHVTNNSTIDGLLTTANGHITDSLQVDGSLVADKICVTEKLKSETIKTSLIYSGHDIDIMAGVGRSVGIPNIRSRVNNQNLALIDPLSMKASKIFLVDKNIILNADASCDGIEIIIVNRNISGNIIIRDTTSIVDTISSQNATKIVYVCSLNKWFKI